jgi:hypothetical protein
MKIKVPTISKNKILLIALVLVAGAAFYFFTRGEEEPLTTAVAGGGVGTIGQELIIELNRLKALRSIRDDIFRDNAFISLEDFTQTVVAQPLGRNNPFAPIGNN